MSSTGWRTKTLAGTSPAKTRRGGEAADAEAPAPAALPAPAAALAAMLDQSDPTDGEEAEDQACLFEAEVVSTGYDVNYDKLGWVRIVPGQQIYDDTKNRRFVIPRFITSEDGMRHETVVAYESEQYRAGNLADYHRKRLDAFNAYVAAPSL